MIEAETINDLIFDKAEEQRSEQTYKRDKNSPEIKYIAYTYYVTYFTPKVHYRMFTKSGKTIAEGFIGGAASSMEYGSINYSNYFSNSYALSSAWRNNKYGLMAGRERDAYTAAINFLQSSTLSYCMYPTTVDFSVRYVDEKKGRTVYADLLQARDYYLDAVSTIRNDQITLINKLIQSDYISRKETMNKAIAIWEKALAEADFDNKKARIDSKVGRHLYYNLALAYLWIDDFAKAKEYAQGRKKDLGSWDKNLLSGIRDLSALIDDRALRQDANKSRTLLLSDSNVYVYKDPATRLREKEEALKAQVALQESLKAARLDSLARSKKGTAKSKAGVKGTATASANSKTKPASKATVPKNSLTQAGNR